MAVLTKAFETARQAQARVVMPEMDDPRIAAAAQQLQAQGLARPVALLPPSEAHIEAVLRVRPGKERLARKLVEKPLVRAAAMVACGEADVMVAGAASATRRVIEAASFAIGMEAGTRLPSSFFLMVFPDGRELVFADCAVNVAPDADGLADIAQASAQSARSLLGHADLAMLSFSTLASGAGASVDLVAQATAVLGERGVQAIGPIQADAALNASIAAKKGVSGGAANVLIFPNLDAGNIAYKLAQELANAQALGPFLQGFKHPVCDLSRGASVDDIIAATAITIAMG